MVLLEAVAAEEEVVHVAADGAEEARVADEALDLAVALAVGIEPAAALLQSG